MKRTRWGLLLIIFVIGGILGAGAVVGSTYVNRYTSTDAFCTSCHSMKFVGNDPHFIQSAHRS
ncbi:MAG TPA: NapC/NirT family cytochrome c, partial [Mycobacterium sp.]|nr:NapC/NirT family cytochrome c [Mycobacterium sp.]